MIRTVHILLRQGMLGALMLALLALPFVHRTGAEPVAPEISQIIAMGGNLADICGQRGEHRAGGCESCNICAAIMLPPHGQHLRPARVPVPLDALPAGPATALQPAANTMPPARAPPHA